MRKLSNKHVSSGLRSAIILFRMSLVSLISNHTTIHLQQHDHISSRTGHSGGILLLTHCALSCVTREQIHLVMVEVLQPHIRQHVEDVRLWEMEWRRYSLLTSLLHMNLTLTVHGLWWELFLVCYENPNCSSKSLRTQFTASPHSLNSMYITHHHCLGPDLISCLHCACSWQNHPTVHSYGYRGIAVSSGWWYRTVCTRLCQGKSIFCVSQQSQYFLLLS